MVNLVRHFCVTMGCLLATACASSAYFGPQDVYVPARFEGGWKTGQETKIATDEMFLFAELSPAEFAGLKLDEPQKVGLLGLGGRRTYTSDSQFYRVQRPGGTAGAVFCEIKRDMQIDARICLIDENLDGSFELTTYARPDTTTLVIGGGTLSTATGVSPPIPYETRTMLEPEKFSLGIRYRGAGKIEVVSPGLEGPVSVSETISLTGKTSEASFTMLGFTFSVYDVSRDSVSLKLVEMPKIGDLVPYYGVVYGGLEFSPY